MRLISGIVVVVFGLCLIGFALLIVVHPGRAERFLNAFASSARTHYTEQVLRLVVGAALVVFAPSMWYSDLFGLLGWLMVVTAVGLFLVPWRWHHRFSRWAIPLAIRYLPWYALATFALGAFILYGASRAAGY